MYNSFYNIDCDKYKLKETNGKLNNKTSKFIDKPCMVVDIIRHSLENISLEAFRANNNR